MADRLVPVPLLERLISPAFALYVSDRAYEAEIGGLKHLAKICRQLPATNAFLLPPLMARVAHRQLRGEFTITRRTRLAEKDPAVSAGPIRLVPEWFVIVLVHSFVVRAVAPVPVRRSTELRSALKLILRDVRAIAAKLRVVV